MAYMNGSLPSITALSRDWHTAGDASHFAPISKNKALVPVEPNQGDVNLPPHWKRTRMQARNINYATYKIKGNPDCPIAMVFGMGLRGKLNRSKPSHYDIIRRMERLGIPCFVIELADPGRLRHFENGEKIEDVFDQIYSDLLGDENSPLYKFTKHRQLVFLPHSTSAVLTLKAFFLADDDHILHKRKSLVIPLGAYLDTANASRDFSNILKYWGYNLYSTLVRDRFLGTTWIDRLYLKRSGFLPQDLVRCTENATHGQGKAIRKNLSYSFMDAALGRQSLLVKFQLVSSYLSQTGRQINPLEIPAAIERLKRTNIHFIHGEDDPASCPKTAESFAKDIGARFTSFEGVGHNPLVSSARVYQTVLKIVKKHTDYNINTHAYKRVEALPILLGCELPAKRHAGFFNTLASATKRLLGRSIGNPEMRRQTESRTMDAGNALSL